MILAKICYFLFFKPIAFLSIFLPNKIRHNDIIVQVLVARVPHVD